MSTTGDATADDSEEIKSNKKECTSCEQKNDGIIEGIDSVVLDNMSTCACCGKEGNSDDMNTCNRCQMVKYCNAACKKKHRTKHKKKCDRRVAWIYDEQLFKEHPPEECPLCLLPMTHNVRKEFKHCCNKTICDGCFCHWVMQSKLMSVNGATSQAVKTFVHFAGSRLEKRKKMIENGNALACFHYGIDVSKGNNGLPRDLQKACELYLKAGELGCADGYCALGGSYYHGRGVEVDMEKAKYYFGLACMKGSISARINLGIFESKQTGNYERAFKHWIIAARAGNEDALDWVKKKGFMNGFVTKDEYADTFNQQALKHFMIAARAGDSTSLRVVKIGFEGGLITKDEYASTLRAYQKICDEAKSGERDRAKEMREISKTNYKTLSDMETSDMAHRFLVKRGH